MERVKQFSEKIAQIKQELAKDVVGQEDINDTIALVKAELAK